MGDEKFYYGFIDIENVCTKRIKDLQNKGKQGEVLSVGFTIRDEENNEITSFYRTVKPKYNPILTPYCKEFTKLKQEEIDNSKDMLTVMYELYLLLGIYKVDKIYCFGSNDRLSVLHELEWHKGERFSKKIRSLVQTFTDAQLEIGKRAFQNGTRLSLQNYKDLYGIEGKVKHNALSDARDLADVFYASKTTALDDNMRKDFIAQKKWNNAYSSARRIHESFSDENIYKSLIQSAEFVCDKIYKINQTENLIEDYKIQALIDDIKTLLNMGD